MKYNHLVCFFGCVWNGITFMDTKSNTLGLAAFRTYDNI